MLELKSKAKLSTEAITLAKSCSLVHYHSTIYLPVDYETGEHEPPPDIDRTTWMPLNREKIRRMAADMFDTLFGTDAELASFEFMVMQAANPIDKTVDSLLVRTRAGLRELNDQGHLVTVSGDFRPNTLVPMLNEDQADKDRVLAVIVEWLQSEEEAESLLRHLATCLAPGWSAVKYVLLLGDGRNGKSLLLKMLTGLFGTDNVSHVPRQEMAQGTPMVIELNGKLLNLVYDGPAEYLKDSGREKSLIAGERVSIKELYKSSPVQVQTNGLFIEGLQHEPKTKDKSSALQKRLVRFQFPNVYDLDHSFERAMLTKESLGALLSLMVDRYVREGDVAGKLVATSMSLELQLDQMYTNSMAMQFLRYLEEEDSFGAKGILNESIAKAVGEFKAWRLKLGDYGTYSDPDVQAMLLPLVNTERRTERVDGKPRKVRRITSFKVDAVAFIDSLKGTTDDEDMVEGRQPVHPEGPGTT